MKKSLVLVFCISTTLFGSQDVAITGWQELPRVTLFEKVVSASLQSVSASIALYCARSFDSQHHIPRWADAVSPAFGAVALGPTVIKGVQFKKKTEELQKLKKYDPANFMDPLLYVNALQHPFESSTTLTSGASLWKAYTSTDSSLQKDFAAVLLASLDYDSAQWGLRAVSEAKKHIERMLHDIKQYSDIEDRLQRIAYFQFVTVPTRADHFLNAEPEDLESFVQKILDSGTYCQPVVINTITKYVQIESVSPWYADDFVYYYASWYGFELLKEYTRLLALERIWSSLISEE